MPGQKLHAAGTSIAVSDNFESRVPPNAEPAREVSDRRLDRLITCGFAALIIYSAIRNIFWASIKPFWFDEVLTSIVTRQRSAAAIWHALAHAADTNPPAYYLLENVFTRFISNEQVALRIPSLLGFCCTLWCLFVFVKRRYGTRVAAVAGMLPLVTILYEYGVEARPYCLPVGCIAIALVCYQRAPAARWMIGLGLSLAAAEAFHYYSVFAIVPFAAAEAALFAKTRWFRRSVWLALVAGGIPLIAFWPLLASIKAYYGPTNWAPATLSSTLGVYSWLFRIPSPFDEFLPVITPQSIALLLILAIGTACAAAVMTYRALKAKPEETPFFHERVLVACFLALPFIIFAAMKITHGGQTQRYMLPSILGFSIGVSYILHRARPKLIFLLGMAMLVALSFRELTFWLRYVGTIEVGSDTPHIGKIAGYENLPIAISPTLDYLSFTYYGSPQWANQYYALIDLHQSMAYIGSDSFDRQLLALRPLVPMHVDQFENFRRQYPAFLLCSTSSGGDFRDWWPLYLIRQGYSLKRVLASGQTSIYLVTANSLSPATGQSVIPPPENMRTVAKTSEIHGKTAN